jgi:hypothetical protein
MIAPPVGVRVAHAVEVAVMIAAIIPVLATIATDAIAALGAKPINKPVFQSKTGFLFFMLKSDQ